jgi:hypothetical protein
MGKYTPPPVSLGQMVIWWDCGESDTSTPFAAVVTGVGTEALSLMILPPSSHNAMVRDGVRHNSDPNRSPALDTECGTWDYTDETYELHRLRDMVERLTKALGEPQE